MEVAENHPSPLAAKVPALKGGKDAETEYRRLIKHLVKLGHLTELSRQSLINYCEAYSLASDALDQMRDEGSVIENPEKGTKYLHPAYGVWSSAQKVMDAEAKNLGMTPKSLEEISKPPAREKKQDGPSNFFTRK